MTQLTETIIDIADCHTTLYYLSGAQPPAVAPLPFGTRDEYIALHQNLASPIPIGYADVRPGHTGVVLDKLWPAYEDEQYWHRYLGATPFNSYPKSAWKDMLPIKARLTTRVEFVNDGEFSFTVRPIPRVILYPFGWSACVSLRLTGEHTLDELSAFMQHLFAKKVFRRVPPHAAPEKPPAAARSLREFFGDVAEGVRVDAFGADETNDGALYDDVVSVVTVLAKHGGNSPSPGALNEGDENTLRRIAKPVGALSKDPFAEHHYVRSDDELGYVVAEGHGRFIWMDSLLRPTAHNRQHLRCHHNNTFLALVQSLHLYRLLHAASKEEPVSPALSAVLKRAAERLKSREHFLNIGLVFFLKLPVVQEAIERVLPTPKKP